MGFRGHITPDVPISKTRLEALSDGVIAVVLTLLVIDLKPEGLDGHAHNAEVWASIRHLWFHLFGYFITFAITCAFWYQHHGWFHALSRLNRVSFFINSGFLFAVTLLPFSVSILIKAHGTSAALLCYFANLGLMGAMLALGWRHAHAAGFISPQADPAAVGGFQRLSQGFVLAAVLGGVMAFIAPFLAGLAYALPFILLIRGQRKATAPAAAPVA